MSRRNLKTRLAEHYGGQTMRAEDAARLAELAMASDQTDASSSAIPMARRWSRVGLGLAAMVGIVIGWGMHALVPNEGKTDLVADVDAGSNVSAGETVAKPAPRLVALSVRADWCPACPIVGVAFDDLFDEYGDQRVQFVILDVTDPKSRRQARYLAATLGLEWMSDTDLSRTGTIKLVDRKRKTVLASLTNPADLPQMKTALREELR